MIPSLPTAIPQQTGCIVLTGVEICPGAHWFYCTIWARGRAACRSIALPAAPSLDQLTADLEANPHLWSPVALPSSTQS